MDYYRIEQKQKLRNILQPIFPSLSEIWEKEEPLFLPGTADMPEEYLVFLPFYESNAFLVSEPVKKIWMEYQRGGRFRSCAFGSVPQRMIYPYCFVMPRIIDAIHPDTEYHKTGEVRELCLDKQLIRANKVFCVKTLRRMMLIISEDVLEEMMREKITGFQWNMISAH